MFDPALGEFVALLEDPAATFTATQIKEYGLADIWGARGDETAEALVRKKWRTSERTFPEFVARLWYSHHGSTPPDRRQAKGAVAFSDGLNDWRDRYAGELLSNPYLAGAILKANGDLGGVYAAARLSKREAQCFGMYLSGMSRRQACQELEVVDGAYQNHLKRAESKLKAVLSGGDLLMDVKGKTLKEELAS